MNQDGFTDLRLGRGSGEGQEGFWPSFTDIMTVIVMIFLIALVVLMVRNMELVSQLRATMEAERIAAALAAATGKEKDQLSSALGRTEDRLQQMQLEVMRLQEEGRRYEDLISEQRRLIEGLSGERDELTQQKTQLLLARRRLQADLEGRQTQLSQAQREVEQKQQQLNAAQQDIAALEEGIQRLRTRFAESQDETDRLQNVLAEQRQQIEQARQSGRDLEQRYLVLAGDYDQLKVKYDKLVRPARSSAGRHLVEVRYQKAGDDYRIAWREGIAGSFRPISRPQLDAALAELSSAKENGLYVKVIFPENSGLSYSEAWEFTQHLHSNYDYYFKGSATKERNKP